MARIPNIFRSEFPYHVCARSNNQDWFDLPPQVCWDIFSKQIKKVKKDFGFLTHAFVLMANHYHWILSTPHSNLGEGMCYFQTQTSKEIGLRSDRINHVWGNRYKPTLIMSSEHFAHSIRYVYQNPLRAQAEHDVRDYPWSTFLQKGLHESLIGFDEFIPDDPIEHLLWLNTIPEHFTQNMKAALRRAVFRFPRDEKTRKRITGKEFLWPRNAVSSKKVAGTFSRERKS
jgi:REP element-mobilizing transposase RayT